VEKKCHFGLPKFDLFKHKPKCVEYEWVLKKKHTSPFKGLFAGHKSLLGHGGDACGGCGETTYASPQGGVWASGQGTYGSGQGGVWGSGQVGGSGQVAPAGQYTPPAEPVGDGAGPAPDAPPAAAAPTASNGSLLFLAPAGN
jgi:hypothetical protein